mmetsp:Transcript_34799/g.96010  ORF Transcript_34799/g.96010 Transcript_34799/m.96010 type:complete len:219 (+) Transcript_34799:720-1376(+)
MGFSTKTTSSAFNAHVVLKLGCELPCAVPRLDLTRAVISSCVHGRLYLPLLCSIGFRCGSGGTCSCGGKFFVARRLERLTFSSSTPSAKRLTFISRRKMLLSFSILVPTASLAEVVDASLLGSFDGTMAPDVDAPMIVDETSEASFGRFDMGPDVPAFERTAATSETSFDALPIATMFGCGAAAATSKTSFDCLLPSNLSICRVAAAKSGTSFDGLLI